MAPIGFRVVVGVGAGFLLLAADHLVKVAEPMLAIHVKTIVGKADRLGLRFRRQVDRIEMPTLDRIRVARFRCGVVPLRSGVAP